MPEVKWVHENYLHDHALRKDHKPVLTLDQLEAWITKTYHDAGYEGGIAINDLLAQVQAWKEQT